MRWEISSEVCRGLEESQVSPTQSMLVNPRQLRTVLLPLTPPTVPVEGLGSLMHPGGCVASDGAGNHAGSRTFLLLSSPPLLCCAVPSRRWWERPPPPPPLPRLCPHSVARQKRPRRGVRCLHGNHGPSLPGPAAWAKHLISLLVSVPRP